MPPAALTHSIEYPSTAGTQLQFTTAQVLSAVLLGLLVPITYTTIY